MKERKKRAKLPLKSNGELVDVRHALGTLEMLRTTQLVHPERFAVLVALAQGRPEDVGPERIAEFRKERGTYLEDSEDRLRPEIANLLASSLETHDNCYTLVQPFRLTSGGERAVADAALEDFNQRLVDLFIPKPGRGGPSSR